MSSHKEDNRKRLINLISQIKVNQNPSGWSHVSSIAVGGLTTIFGVRVKTLYND